MLRGDGGQQRDVSGLNLAVFLLTFILIVCGSGSKTLAASDTGVEALPTPDELPVETVAVVGHLPREAGTVTTDELTRAIAQTAAFSGLKSTPAPGQTKYKKIEESALGERLDAIWIPGQAAEMEIAVTKREVSVELAHIKKKSFRGKGAFHAFLEHFHLTVGEIRERVELQLLSTLIVERIIESAGGREEVRQALSNFVTSYNKRWRSRTVCATQYAIERCSNSPTPGTRSHPQALASKPR